MEITIDNYFEKRYSLFKWRSETSTANKLVMAFFMACITGLMAQIVIPLPWTPVPITAQTFAVLLAGILLGRFWGGLSMIVYLTHRFIGCSMVYWNDWRYWCSYRSDWRFLDRLYHGSTIFRIFC